MSTTVLVSEPSEADLKLYHNLDRAGCTLSERQARRESWSSNRVCAWYATTMSNSEPPPVYSQEDESTLLERSTSLLHPQILIVPTTSPLGFQKGYLGADNERAAIEGELQVKGASGERWGRVCVYHVDCVSGY